MNELQALMQGLPMPKTGDENLQSKCWSLHPQANRFIMINGKPLGYKLVFRDRRYIGLIIKLDGLVVNAPLGVEQSRIDQFIEEKTNWILLNLERTNEKKKSLAHWQVQWGNGAQVPYLGQKIIVEADWRASTNLGLITLEPAGQSPNHPHPVLRLPIDSNASEFFFKDMTCQWLMVQARRHLAKRLEYFAPQLGVKFKQFSLSSAKTLWGSAKGSGEIRLNWKLIILSEHLIDYVVVHELAHLCKMNHGRDFWEVVKTVLPDYEDRVLQLRNVEMLDV